jgi:hypothetical protein
LTIATFVSPFVGATHFIELADEQADKTAASTANPKQIVFLIFLIKQILT